MFLLVRCLNGKKETLKDASSDHIKTFAKLSVAEAFCTKLNHDMNSDRVWKVEQSPHYK